MRENNQKEGMGKIARRTRDVWGSTELAGSNDGYEKNYLYVGKKGIFNT